MADMNTTDKLRALIEHSGLSASAFARAVLIREPRTIRRWLAGDSPVPDVVVEWVEQAHATLMQQPASVR